ncbi:Related to PDR16 protein [Taphrina deformans PYCC 5710]|uniref:Related to PDR16 protein n=1 Tax=Taphrina deformans (strain PYCC 5710 / ATCC 11124 / CBS 356.35 / IMI 108563 / JCM 9778 / NBRC 8474) TaxID=1097556 RepID=R4X9Z8_TAPDE|nr:Related to PDR16 protein [Taphrina deformans PYCC 5710]|eukprot:CCG81079.1 Related to PDR16 protein [Taphrina deformans PYCC 5710]
MGIFGRTNANESAKPARRPNARTTPLAVPSSSSTPETRPALSEAQLAQYHNVLNYLRSSEHGLTLTDTEQFYLSKEQILRFCRATKWDISKTKSRIVTTLKWRRDYGVEKITAEHIEPEATTGKQVIFGFDNAQRPCLYLFPGRQNTEVSPRQVQYLVWCLERVVDLMPIGVENLALLVNYKGSTGDKNPGIGQGREVLGILQTHYVETLGRALVINIPFFVWGFFKLITPFIDPLTREKLKFNEDLTLHVPRSQLDSDFGGEIVFDYVQKDYWPTILKMSNEARSRKQDNWRKAGGGIGISEDVMKGGTVESSGGGMAMAVEPHTSASALPPGAGPTGSVEATTDSQQASGTALVQQANAERLSKEPIEAVYVPSTEHGPALAQVGKEIQ